MLVRVGVPVHVRTGVFEGVEVGVPAVQVAVGVGVFVRAGKVPVGVDVTVEV